MKGLLFFLFGCCGIIASAFAQDDDSTLYINGIPVYDDSVQFFPQIDYLPKENHVMVNPDRLPKKLKKRLKKGDQYSGWEKSPVYLDTNTKLYLITIKGNDSIRIYGLNENGIPMTYDEIDVD